MARSRKTDKPVILSGRLSLGAAAEVCNQLRQAFDAADIINILLQDVEDVDLSTVQLFCAAHRSALARNKTLVLQNNLPVLFVQLIEEAGLQGHIGCSLGAKGGCLWEIAPEISTEKIDF
jgi:ABC-type transporter Mla MlaB component